MLGGLEGFFEVYFSVLSVVTAQVPCPLSGVLKVGNTENPQAEVGAAGAEQGGSELPARAPGAEELSQRCG